MTININPNRINVTTGGGSNVSSRKRETSAQAIVPKRASVGVIPAPESLATLIRSAVAALREGTTWDRGTILNLLV